MPARPVLSPSLPPSPNRRTNMAAATTVGVGAGAAFSLILIFAFCFRKISKKRTVPSSDEKPPYRYSYANLRRATDAFSPSRRLGQGGFGSVYRGTLPGGQNVAVKVMDSGSLQGEREFQNEILFASRLDSPYVITALGFSSDRKHRTMLLVYELMPNGNLQDALLHRKCPELGLWAKRFSLCVDIARGIEYLHGLEPPVVHGDVKPSNVLLDALFIAKIADFGLAWVKERDPGPGQGEIKVEVVEESEKGDSGLELRRGEVEGVEDCGSVAETESVMTTTTAVTGFEEFNFGADQSPENYFRGPGFGTSPETVDGASASPEMVGGKAAGPLSPEGNLDAASFESGKRGGKGLNDENGKDWWWKQDHGGPAKNGAVKDYVMEWIGTEIKKERPKSNWIAAASSNSQMAGNVEKKKSGKRLDWWNSFDEDKNTKVLKKEKKRQPREWWKEEYCEELEKKKKKKKKKEDAELHSDKNGVEDWWPQDEALYMQRRKKNKRSKSRSSQGSVDWNSGELFRGHHNSHDSVSGEIPKTGGISSTPSMRGTVCYVAPEYNGGGMLSEKSDVYSFGVLLLVLIAGRRPLQVAGSPMSEFHRANLIHWARHLARTGKLLDLVDKSVQSVERDQAVLCITVALLCLQKSPSRRPSMKEVVKIFTGEFELPQLPMEFSPSPPSRFPFRTKSHRKVR